ncbi:unnamed protein product [Bemisia tabaci]|uniref:Uncharacterized protein n=1 Tax=Bemisia tabaci TaxID=7038 RepID=A0A9N9ZZY8_BEMTA|nr:unnamed protein product [Bemisia tabaci]
MHTLNIFINTESIRVDYAEILPLLREKQLIVIDTHVRSETVIDLLKKLPPAEVKEYIGDRLKRTVRASKHCVVRIFSSVYGSDTSYEADVLARNPSLPPVTYDEEGYPKDISLFTQKRVEVELAKFGFVYNYSRLDYARKALRRIAATKELKSKRSAADNSLKNNKLVNSRPGSERSHVSAICSPENITPQRPFTTAQWSGGGPFKQDSCKSHEYSAHGTGSSARNHTTAITKCLWLDFAPTLGASLRSCRKVQTIYPVS